MCRSAGEFGGVPSRGNALAARPNPDLIDICVFILVIELGVENACAGAHHLNIARCRAAFIARAVLVADGPASHIGDNFHVAMRMRVETGMRRNDVIIDDQQFTKAHFLRIMIAGKTEMMLRLQPSVIGPAKSVKLIMC